MTTPSGTRVYGIRGTVSDEFVVAARSTKQTRSDWTAGTIGVS